ncbi:MAG: Uma2 family endonuclease [Acetobacteraceae bacterium]|nr:Uma2 family endonuclease [Acetobacteraceae bacterium]MBV8526294.1 Uma2 family endonuclease [Acetobacteraceae bacterium]MBV8589804.1 Uma2 family endonuclease [Acetobacteraceae bacterium]
MVAVAKIPVRMSVDEFLNWDSGDSFTYELVDGEPIAMAPANRTHGMLQNELGALIRNHLRARGSPCDVVANPGVIPRLHPDYNVRVPDLGVTCTSYDSEQAALPEPVLLIEVLSPSNQAKTWRNIWTYTTIPSVREILVLRGDRIAAELLRRQPGGEWPERPMVLTSGELVLESIGFRISLAEIYARTRLDRA